ncbi:MAG: Omp28-related outer membrane protein [Flavobacteriales bacterium]|nr:Omp28-related outer membrane protein [Flavobacteriales bacterium]
MKKLIFILAAATLAFASCDKVENPYPVSNQGDYSLYPDGDSAYYAANVWPTFTTNTNTDRTILIEDFTGHRCIYCPAAAELAHQLYEDNPGRVLISSIHSGPTGQMEGNQQVVPSEGYVENFTNDDAFAIGFKFGNGTAGSPFQGNPFGSVSRKDHGNGFPVLMPQQWENATNSTIAANDLKVNIQAVGNYYPSTRGFFLHTEVDILDAGLSPDDLNIVVHLIEDSLVAPQKLSDNSTEHDYIHRDIFRGSIDGFAFGRPLDADHLEASGNYEYFYIYKLPSQYNPDNMHVIIYVRDAVTEEIYQVIKKDL